MRRVVILGPGGSGKSTLATRLGQLTGLPVIELDKHFWQPGPAATAHHQWAAIQQEIVQRDRWIMDGDLGPYDVLHVRLRTADTVIVLDFPFVRCAWRAIRRSRERADFWRWLWSYRRQSLPVVMDAIATNADGAALHVLRSPRALRRFLAQVEAGNRVDRTSN
jgi:adenylate kinase family enzyme